MGKLGLLITAVIVGLLFHQGGANQGKLKC